ncbi:MAG: aminoglycoside phosphotransferase family protein [Pseudomonadota bacterium]
MAAFGVDAPKHICETPIAHIWRVDRSPGSYAALKIYKDGDMQNEAAGLTFMARMDGRSTAKIYRTHNGAVLMEWLDGPSLGDVSRGGDDIAALNNLIDVAKTVHAKPHFDGDYPPLSDWFEDLFNLNFSPNCNPKSEAIVQKCQSLGRTLIDSQRDLRALHGDLHHDNVLKGKRGYCIIDAKGVYGERAYELANAVRNPVGADALLRDTVRILRYCRTISSEFNVNYQRFWGWVIAHCSLSIAWRCSGTLADDEDLDLLAIMFDLAKQEGLSFD